MQTKETGRQFVLATHNAEKREELARILQPIGIVFADLPFEDVEETGSTFLENARLKARAACAQTGLPAIADDSGLAVDALGGAPGVYSARYAGPGATGAQRNEKLLREMEGVPSERRTARYVCVICCAFPDGKEITAEGICEGYIGTQPQGEGGFGYDPVFFVNGLSFAQIPSSEKDCLSHRGKALTAFSQKLQEYARQ